MFITDDAAFVPAGTRSSQVFVYDTVHDRWSLASVGIDAAPLDSGVNAALISADGEHIVALSRSEFDSGGIFIFPRP